VQEQGAQGAQGATGVSPGGTTNYVSKFTGATTLGNSQIFDNGTNIGIGTASPTQKLDILDGKISLDDGGYSVFVGRGAGFYDPFDTYSVGIGVDALYSGSGGEGNTAVGYATLYSNQGTYNTAIGTTSLNSNTTGDSNTANGAFALYSNTTANANTANGASALSSNTTGANNTAIGTTSLFSNTTGANNIANGFTAGRFIANGVTANTITNNSVFLGASTKALADNQTNQIVIGYDAIGLGSNTAVLGNDSILSSYLKGDIYINSPSGVSQGSNDLIFRGTNSSSTIRNQGVIATSPYVSNSNAGTMILSTNNTSSVMTERVRIDGIGNVGIGTTTTSGKLTVSGNIGTLFKISNENGEDYFSLSQTTNDKAQIQIGDIDEQYGTMLVVDVEQEEIKLFTPGTIQLGDGGGFGNFTLFSIDDVNSKFSFSNGNVGIGTTSPTEKLHVSGSARITDTFLAGKSALPNSTYTLASGSTSAITPNSTFAQDSVVGEVIVGFAGADITLGQLVFLRHTGDWNLADASSASGTSINLLGIALKTVSSGNPVDVLIDGVISMVEEVITVSSIGEPLYVDTTAGKITNTAPSGGGEVVRIVGHYIKAEGDYYIITFKPDGTWIEL
jgi:hypothetical protein